MLSASVGWGFFEMSDTRSVAATSSSYASFSGWFYYLSFSLPLVFLIGVPTIFITRSIHYAHFPDDFVMDSPTISGSAAAPPASHFFEYAMFAVTFCIFMSWALNLMMNSDRLARLPREERPRTLTFVGRFAAFCGVAAGFFLCLLGMYTLNNGHEVHMWSSWAFYITQVLAILLDTIFVFWLARICSEHHTSVEHFGRRCRVVLGVSILICSLIFLFMYQVRDFLSEADRYPAQLFFVFSEYVVAILCFAYPLAGFAEMRRHYREIAPTL